MQSRTRTLWTVGIAAVLAVCLLSWKYASTYSNNRIDSSTTSSTEAAGYVPAGTCAGCHRTIWDSYRKTGMGRSFQKLAPDKINQAEGAGMFYHAASDTYYKTYSRDGKYYQRRHQQGSNGSEDNILEKEIHYVLGSGNHARTYLHRKSNGVLIELPVSWYAEKGGYWAMNPGYDRPDNEGFRREVPYECMFCHTGYSAIKAGTDSTGSEPTFPDAIPEGIDCQRCHGPGAAHVRAAGTGNKDAIRSSIVNPAKLAPERQLEVCMQCHLETTSFRLPHAIRRYDRGVFSYRPGEPLGAYQLQFDHEQGRGFDDKFEIASHAYRLRKSACFTASAGRLTCTTCHNPHDIPRGDAAASHYDGVCKGCHAQTLEKQIAAKRHPAQGRCVECHMPSRRTDDVVHVVMTDHYIQRRKPARDLLAPLNERHDTDTTVYHGPVKLYYPATLPSGTDTDLYMAVAQVKNASNLKEGLPQLTRSVEQLSPTRPEAWLELAEAYAKAENPERAVHYFTEALQRKADLRPASIGLGRALAKLSRYDEAANAIRKALSDHPDDAVLFNELGLILVRQGKRDEAITAFRNSTERNPDESEAWANLGAALANAGDLTKAEQSYRDAIRQQPDLRSAHLALGDLLTEHGDAAQAAYHFKRALSAGGGAVAHYRYGLALARNERFGPAREQFELAVKLDGNFADALSGLGDMLALEGKAAAAVENYRRALAIAPDLGSAHLGLGSLFAMRGNTAEAISHLRSATRSPDSTVRDSAEEQLRALGQSSR